MSFDYDELLQDNPFYQTIVNAHHSIITDAVNKGWIICIPCKHSLESSPSIKEQTILEHVLVPREDDGVIIPSAFTTLSNKNVTVCKKHIVQQNESKGVKILFDETVYTEEQPPQKYILLCIERRLDTTKEEWSGDEFHKEDLDNLIQLKNVQDCIQLLWPILGELHQIIGKTAASSFRFGDVSSDALRETYKNLYRECIRISWHKNYSNYLHKYGNKIVSLAIETYLQYYIYDKLFGSICILNSQADGKFNKMIRNQSQIQLKDLGIPNELLDCVLEAKYEFYALNKFCTVLEKLACLTRVFDICSKNNKHYVLTTDDLLKVLIFLILKSNINNFSSNLRYLNDFRISSITSSDQNTFLITTLEAAMEYVKNEEFCDLSNEILCDSSVTILRNLNDFFYLVQNGNLNLIRSYFGDEDIFVNNDTIQSLCHPLCSCDKCNEFSIQFTINSHDENGRNALHIAALHGQVLTMEYLINRNVHINLADNSEYFPIHYAAVKGHQNALLLLLHSNSLIDPKDYEGNTPLHLSTNNGHENCVKAILYFAEQKGLFYNLNEQNNAGDTPLHFASKWSYLTVIKILLEYSADPTISNKFHQTAIDLAHDENVKKLLLDSKSFKTFPVKKISQIPHKFGTSAKNSKHTKKMALIQRAIEYNDLPLMCFYMNIQASRSTFKSSFKTVTCHPLCACEKCLLNVKDSFSNFKESGISDDSFDVNTCNSQGYTSLHLAAKCGNVEIVNALLEAGSSSNLKTFSEHYTPLHLACIHQHVAIVKQLLSTCNMINETDVHGKTPMYYARLNNNIEIMNLITSCKDE